MKRLLLATSLWFATNPLAIANDDENEMETSAEESADDEKSAASSASTASPNSKETTCSNGQGSNQLVRKVWITYGNDEGNDCKVHYAKETEEPGQKQVLWKSQHNSDYCQEKAQHMIDKLKGWGWSCSERR